MYPADPNQGLTDQQRKEANAEFRNPTPGKGPGMWVDNKSAPGGKSWVPKLTDAQREANSGWTGPVDYSRQGGGLVAGGGGGFDSNYVGNGAPGGGMMMPQGGGQSFKPIPQLAGNEPIGGGLASMYPQGTGQASMFGPTGRQGGGSTAPNTGAGNQWEGWDFAKQGGGNPAAGGAPDAGIIAQNQQRAGLAGLKQQAAGPQVMPVAPNQSVVSKANPQGLNMLVQQSKKKPLKKSPQTYRPTQVGVYT